MANDVGDMIFSERQPSGSLEVSRVVLASLAIWLAVTGLVTRDVTAVSQASPAGTVFLARAKSTTREIVSADEPPNDEVPAPGRTPPDEFVAVDEQNSRPQALVATVAPAVAIAPAPFAFPADVGGQLLAERLVPPARFDVPAVPFVGQPEPWRGLRFDPLPRDISPLTATIIPRAPQPVSYAESSRLTSGSFDLPNLPRDSTPNAVAPIRFSPASRSFVPSTDPNEVPPLPISSTPPKERLDPKFDPARRAAEVLLFAARGMSAAPTAFIKLSRPDPFPQARDVQLIQPIADLDPPLFAAGRPTAPRLGASN